MEKDTYFSVSSPSTGMYKEKGSRFLSFLYPVRSPDAAAVEIERLKKEYHDARHHCYAWRLGPEGDLRRTNDDGEPSSTAGRPILGQILSNSLSDVLIVVVRYFGGTKLGVPGLINAYRSAAADAIAHATIIRKTASVNFSVTFSYRDMNRIMKVMKEFSPEILSQEFDMECRMSVNVRLCAADTFRERIVRASGSCV